MAAPDLFVTPPSVPGELGGGGDGSESHPFHSVTTALERARSNGGGIVNLHGGHYVESVVLDGFDQGEFPLVVQPVGDGEVFIDATLPEFLAPQGPEDQWVPVLADDGEFRGEYVWLRPYDDAAVTGGAFLDEPVHTRLVSYSRREDLTATGQIWTDDVPGGNRVWQLHPDQQQFPDLYRPRDERPWWRPWVYMGPGIWFDPEVRCTTPDDVGGRRVHIRLSPTENNIPGWPDYDPETSDPNQVRLALSREEQRGIFLRNSKNVKFENLTLRFGSPETVRLRNCSDIVFDHCRIRSGSRALSLHAELDMAESNHAISVEHCEIDGGIPTWFFRSDRKDEYIFGPDPPDPDSALATKDELGENRLGHATSGVQLSSSAGSSGVTVHHCEIFNAHDSYVFGDGMEFHHNLVNNLNDDGLAVSATAQTKNAKIYCNVFTRCLTALSFASPAAGPAFVYGNLFDLRQPTLGKRPTGSTTAASLRQGHFFKDGSDEDRIALFHNTCLVLDPGAIGDDLTGVVRAGFAYYAGIGTSEPREALNNIMVAVFTAAGAARAMAYLPPDGFGPTDGNTYLRIPALGAGANFLVRHTVGQDVLESFEFPTLAKYRERYWPGSESGYEVDGEVVDPGFKSFDSAAGRPRAGDDLRLRHHPKSPAKGTAVPIPQELADMYVEATGAPPEDRGCYPSTGSRLRVGVDGRRIYPWLRPHLGPETHFAADMPVVVDDE
jgi:hypothetical protein